MTIERRPNGIYRVKIRMEGSDGLFVNPPDKTFQSKVEQRFVFGKTLRKSRLCFRWVLEILPLAKPNACAIPVAGVGEVPFDCDQIIG